MDENDNVSIFEHVDIRPTAVRLLVYRTMKTFDSTFCLSDLEEQLLTVDKSTLFRTLSLFLEHHLVHSVDDGSGSMKYCICHNDGDCTIEELHCHFYCEHCHKTYCLNDTPVPMVSLPKGFAIHQVCYVMKGICDKCAGRSKG